MRSNRTRGQGQRVQKVKEFRSSKGHVFTKKKHAFTKHNISPKQLFSQKHNVFTKKKKFSATTTKNKVVIKNHVFNKKKMFSTKKCSHLKTCFHLKHVFTKRTCFYHITSQTLRLLTESTQWADLVKIKRA